MANIDRLITNPTPNLSEGANIGVKKNQHPAAEQSSLPSDTFSDTLHVQGNQDAGLIVPPQGRAVAVTTTNVQPRVHEEHVHRMLKQHGLNRRHLLTEYPEHAELIRTYNQGTNSS